MRLCWVLFGVGLVALGACHGGRGGARHDGDTDVGEFDVDGGSVDVADAPDGTDSDGQDAPDPDGSEQEPEPPRALAADELIAGDLDAGAIDRPTAVFYQLLAQFSPDRLPPEYQVDDLCSSLRDVGPMREASALLDSYDPERRSAVEAMLTDPEDPRWLVFPDSMPTAQFAGSSTSCLANFAASESGASGRYLGPAIETTYFRFRAILPTLVDVPKQEQIRQRMVTALDAPTPDVGGGPSVPLRDYLDHAYEALVGGLAMQSPGTLPKVAGGKIPVYVATCDGAANEAFAAPRGFIFVSVQVALEHPELRRVVLPHELFHLVQFTYPGNPPDGLDWAYEASAVVVEDLVAPDVKRWSGRFEGDPVLPPLALAPMDRVFKCPEEPIVTAFKGPCKNRGGARFARYNGAYSRFVLVKFMNEVMGISMSALWQRLAAANGDPREVVDEAAAAELQLALLAEPAAGPPWFSTADRAAFFRAGANSLDFDTATLNRYTFRLDPTAFARSKAWRAAPDDVIGRGGEGLDRLDASALPIEPWGTHRLLLELPAARSSSDPTASPVTDAVHLHIEYSDGAAVAQSVVALGGSGKPGRTFSAAHPLFTQYWPASRVRSTVHQLDPGTANYLLVLISNFGTQPLRYRVSLNLPRACLASCIDHYAAQLLGQRCIDKWCWTDCTGATPDCQAGIDRCIADQTPKVRGYVDGSMVLMPGTAGFCPFLCWPVTGLEAPVTPDPDACKRWDERLCGGRCDTDPAAFQPIAAWPSIDCAAIASGGSVPACN